MMSHAGIKILRAPSLGQCLDVLRTQRLEPLVDLSAPEVIKYHRFSILLSRSHTFIAASFG